LFRLPSLGLKRSFFARLITHFKFCVNFLFHFQILLLSYDTLIYKLLFINLAHWSHFCNLLVHQWLCKWGLI
jgi:hypothetical protein